MLALYGPDPVFFEYSSDSPDFPLGYAAPGRRIVLVRALGESQAVRITVTRIRPEVFVMREANQAKGVLAGCVAVMLLGVQLAAATDGGALVVNEVMASNLRTKADPQGQFDDWIEIYNGGGTPMDIGGMYLTDNLDSPTKWQIPATDPAATTIAAGGYLVIWADGNAGDQGLHACFKLDAGGEEAALFAVDGTTLIDSMTFPTLGCDVSYGRSVDGAGQWRFFTTATPGVANQGGYEAAIGKIEFSHEHGFYEEPFSVTLAADTPEVTIYYTLDGETPGQAQGQGITGTVYAGPISIEKTTCLRAAAIKEGLKPSAVRTQTYIFVADVIRQSPNGEKPGPGWPEPDAGTPNPYSFSGGPQVIDYGMDPDVVNDPRYKDLVDDALLSIPTISLVTPLANLYDQRTGIYVNALEDGRDWERPVSVELMHPDGTEGFQIDAGLRIRGGYGRVGDNPKHGFRLFFRAEYGASELHYPLFGEEGVDTFEKIDLRCEQNYSWAYRGSGDRPRRQEYDAPRCLLPRLAGGHGPALHEEPILPSLYRRPVLRDLSDPGAIRSSLRGVLLRRGQRGLRRDQSRCRPRATLHRANRRRHPRRLQETLERRHAGLGPGLGLLARAGFQLGRNPQPRLRAARRRRQLDRLHDLHLFRRRYRRSDLQLPPEQRSEQLLRGLQPQEPGRLQVLPA